ncbi:MAG: FAD-dependent oxidoreductase [bacterium]
MWDLIVAGSGMAGVGAAISASKNGCKTLLVEKLSFLGGTATASLVTPMMKNMLSNGESLNTPLFDELTYRLRKSGNGGTHENLNSGWFNPEIMKYVLDDMCEEAGVEILFDSIVSDVTVSENKITSIEVVNKAGKQFYNAKYFIDATGDADLAAFAGVEYVRGNENGINQAVSLRFMMSGVDIEALAKWIKHIDPSDHVSPVCRDENGNILLTTAYTSEDKDWKLKPIFELGLKEKIIKPEDVEYFQIFSVPGQKSTIAFNCPRISSKKELNTLNPQDLSYAYIMGRKQILRIAEFCKKYFIGFEDAFISEIAPLIGVRESRRIVGKYTLTEKDIVSAKKFKNSVAKSNYPVDIHSQEKNKSVLEMLPENDYYEIPLDCLLPKNIDNLLVVGRCISATFRAQASLRIQPTCLAMGENAGIHISQLLNKSEKLLKG